ncbi:MAG: galactose-1-phosphate uridylyltransferase, partial [Actinomycetota bacterium]|nr:galactose-1-phosphate uridylyltransferase [Actinomycetota bacterium]
PGFSAAGAAELEAAAEIVKFTLERLRDRLGDPPYNLYLHTVPFREDGDYHWHMTILPKLSTMAGFEFGTGIMINIAEPDAAAEFLR